jgi:hypothetical protein
VEPISISQPTTRRTAGLLWNGDIYGLLEIGGDVYIVRPGDTVAEYQVTAITRDAIILYNPTINKPIQVPLQGPRAEIRETVGEPPPAELPTQPPSAPFGRETPSSTENEFEEIAPALPELPPL